MQHPNPAEVENPTGLCTCRLLTIVHGDGRWFQSYTVTGPKHRYADGEFYEAVLAHNDDNRGIIDENDCADMLKLFDPDKAVELTLKS